MHRPIVTFALLAFGAAAAQQAPQKPALPSTGLQRGASYVVDPTHTFVNYEIGHYGTSTNRGRFSTRSGSVRINPGGDGGTVDITMDMASINTGVELLNRHIQSRDFLNTAEHPGGRFLAETIELDGPSVKAVSGTLTLMNQARPVRLKANRFKCYLSPMMNRQVCGGDFEATIRRSEWGITWGLAFGFEDEVRLLVQVEAVHVPP